MEQPLSLREQQKKAVRDLIIATALELFLEKGYMQMQMREVYEIAGIGKKTLYRYFSSKEALAFAVEMALLSDMMEETIIDISPHKTGYEQIKELICDHLVPFVYSHPEHIRFFAQFDHIMVGDYPEMDASAQFVSFIQSFEDEHAKLIEIGQSDGSVRKDIDPHITSVTTNNGFIALAERVTLRDRILKQEYGIGKEMLNHQVTMYLDYIKSNN